MMSLLSTVLLLALAAPQDSVAHVTAQQAQALLSKDTTVVILDVRTPEEFNGPSGHLPRAINIPVQELEQRGRELEKYRARAILVYCRSGNRSTRAAKMLRDKNFKVIHMDGGMLQWNAAFPASAKEKE
jgi:rhodanese-related sulfurtransferase